MNGLQIGKPISMSDVPEPELGGRASKWGDVLENHVLTLKRDQALPIKFDRIQNGYYARTAMRKEAKKRGERLLSSLDRKTLTFYFWVEAKENK